MKIEKVGNMKGAVIDTSVVIKWFFEEENSVFQANEVLACAACDMLRLFQPELAKYEFGNVLLKKKTEAINALFTISGFYTSGINFITEDKELSNTTYRLAKILNITYYDASFLAVAKLLNIPLITANPKHQREIEGITVIPLEKFTVEFLRDS